MSEEETIRFDSDPERKGGFGLRPGQIVGAGRYHLVKLLGQGGGGSVWRSFDTRLSVEVALKFISRQVQRDPRAFANLREEVLHSRNLSHPHIVKVFDLEMYGEEDPFISMELVVGRNLSQLLMQQPQQVFAWSYLRPILAQLCSALSYAHRERVVHRDLKPANLMLNEDGELKLTDFGISRQMSETETRLDIRRETSGTLLYMSPQQLEGKKAKPSDDIYSLGATLYELLTGTPPFHRGQILHQILSVEPDPMQQRLAERDVVNPIPAHVRETIAGCLSKMPSGRPANIEEFAKALNLTAGSDLRIDRNDRSSSFNETPPEPPEEPRLLRETVAQSPAWAEEPTPVKPSSGWRKVAAFLVVLLLAGAGAVYQWHPEWLGLKATATTGGGGSGTTAPPEPPVSPPKPNPWLLTEQDLAGLPQVFGRLQAPKTDIEIWFQGHLGEDTRSALQSYSGSGTPSSSLSALVRRDLNGLILGPTLYDVQRFVKVELRAETHALVASALGKEPQIKEEIQHLNRLLVEDTFSGAEKKADEPPPPPPPKTPDPAQVTFVTTVKSARFELTAKETGAKLLLTNQIMAYVAPGQYRVVGTSLSWDKTPIEIDNLEVKAGATATINIATVKVDSSPSGAQLYTGDRLLGTTPKTLPALLNESCTLRFELRGYYPKTISERISQLDVRLGPIELQRAPHPTAGPYTNNLGMTFAQVDLREGPTPNVWFGTTELRKALYGRFFHQEWKSFRQKNLPLNLPEKLSQAWMTSPRQGELGSDADDPVVSVSWQDAKLFCLWLTAFEHEDREHPLPADWEYRLPTDWEWGVAAGLVGEKWDATPRARFEDPAFAEVFPWGGRLPPPKGFANYYGTAYDNNPTIAPVQAYGANALGLFNMHGNMSEWCEDVYDPSADATVTSTINREASNVIHSSKGKRERTVRGGSWQSNPNEQMRSNYRLSFSEEVRREDVGFRVVLARKGARPADDGKR